MKHAPAIGSSCSTSTAPGFACWPRDLSHTARFRHFAKLLYPYHPLFRGGPTELEIVGARSDMLVTRLPDGTRRGIPAWMFDEGICATVRDASYPIVDIASLLELMKLLELNGREIRIARDERTSESKEVCDVKVADHPNSTSIRKPRPREADPGREKVRVHRVVSRTDRSGRRLSHHPRRRGQ